MSPPAPATPAPPIAEAADAPVVAQANAQSASRGAFTDLIAQRELTLGVVVIALAVAMALGAFHALEPGHGKTVVAAYLVGSRGTARHALILGLIVTASHTAGVYLLGGVTFYASQYVVPDRLYPWVALGSGLTIAALGLSLFLRRYAGGTLAHDHHHHGGLAHSQAPAHDHVHDHDRPHAGDGRHDHHHEPGSVSLRQLWALGITAFFVLTVLMLTEVLILLSMGRRAQVDRMLGPRTLREEADEALEAAAKLSDRYIAGRFLPDKAIDLIDEAGARAKLREAGYDPTVAGIAPVVVAEPTRIAFQRDFNGNGVVDPTRERVTYLLRVGETILRRDAGGGAQPVINGVRAFRLTYLDRAGLETVDPAAVTAVRIRLEVGITKYPSAQQDVSSDRTFVRSAPYAAKINCRMPCSLSIMAQAWPKDSYPKPWRGKITLKVWID